MELIVLLVTILIASYFQGVAGFGQGLIAAPLAFALYSKSNALSILVVIGLVLNLMLVRRVKESLDYTRLKPLIIGSVIGMPIGLLFVHYASLAALQIIAGVLSISFACLLVFYKAQVAPRKIYAVAAGVASGFMQTSTTLSGPPLVLVLTGQNTPKQVMRKLMPAYFLGLQLITALLFLPAGLLSIHGLKIGLAATPLVLLGGYAGNHAGHLITQNAYRLLTLAAIVITGLVAIYHGFGH